MKRFYQSIFPSVFISILLLASSLSWAFDPMAPPGMDGSAKRVPSASKKAATVKKAAAFYLRQIVIKGERRSAVINGYIVNEGSYINSALVEKIEENKVTIKHKGKIKVLTLQTRLPKIRR